jgi:hypothetical protein
MTLTPVPSRSASPDPARQAPGPAPLPAAARAPAGAGASRLTRTASQANLPSPLAKRPHGAASGSSGSAGSSPQRRAPLAALHSRRHSPSPEPLPDLDALPELDDIAAWPELTDFPEGDHAPRSPSPSLLFSQAETDQITAAGAQAAAAHAAASQAAEAAPYVPLAEPAEVHVPGDGLTEIRSAPVQDAHKDVVSSLPADLTKTYRSRVSQFLLYLESRSTDWAKVCGPDVPENRRPARLEELVNTGIKEKKLDSGTRAALNKAFDLDLQSAYDLNRQSTSAQFRLKQQAHQDLLKSLPADLTKQVRSYVAQFFCHLEEDLGKKWEDVRACSPNEPQDRPDTLEVLVNAAIHQGRLQPNTRPALNKAFGLNLQGNIRLAPEQSMHQELLQTMPARLPLNLLSAYRSRISRFLIHLESLGTNWAAARGPDVPENRRPAVLEDLVNTAISEYGLNPGTRAALNRAYGLNLLGPSMLGQGPR